MSYSFDLASHGSNRKLTAIVLFSGTMTLFVFMLCSSASALPAQSRLKDDSQACASFGSEFDPRTDIHALEDYGYTVAGLLKEKKFAELDCIADVARSNKVRFPGGAWKLHKIYSGLDEPQPGHATEDDWRKHLHLLDQWITSNPKSITARVALAKSYVGYAWFARGDGFIDTVSQSGWKLFGERIEKAKLILDHATTLHSNCPEWYVAMQQVAQGQSWKLPQATALLEKAVSFEPGYDMYYRVYADYLLPKWQGEDGDAARFAERAANHVSGEAGDVLYFQIGAELICACEDPEFSHMSWPRLQRGFAALEKQYGSSLLNVNAFALMAYKFDDSVAAYEAFKRIGDQWDKETWRTEDWFKENKSWAERYAPVEIRVRATRKEAAANLETAEGYSYQKVFLSKFSTYEQSCLQTAGKDLDKFEFFIKLGKDGGPDDGWVNHPTSIAMCLNQEFGALHTKKEAAFPPPPHDSYWIVLEVDPASFTLNSAAK